MSLDRMTDVRLFVRWKGFRLFGRLPEARLLARWTAAFCAAWLLFPTGTAKAQEPGDADRSRFRFAESYIGVDLRWTPQPGRARFLADGVTERVPIPASLTPGITIGGTHFWGRADFYLTFPIASLGAAASGTDRRTSLTLGTETGVRVYPWRIGRERIRPFVGAAWAAMRYGQESDFGRGPTLDEPRVQLQSGLSWLTRRGMLEVGAQWMPGATIDYPVSREATGRVSLPSSRVWLAYKYLFDATRAWEERVRSGSVAARTEELASRGALSSITLAAGPSSAVPVTASTHTRTARPYLDDRPHAAVYPDLSVGYYHYPSDAAVRLAYRSIAQEQTGYGMEQRLRRRSLSLEALKFVGDYHGFVPFVGASIGPVELSVRESDRGRVVTDEKETRWAPALVFGWDIRPTRVDGWLLRTNLRYAPGLELETAPGRSIPFDHLEFNFIQLVIYPQRLLQSWR